MPPMPTVTRLRTHKKLLKGATILILGCGDRTSRATTTKWAGTSALTLTLQCLRDDAEAGRIHVHDHRGGDHLGTYFTVASRHHATISCGNPAELHVLDPRFVIIGDRSTAACFPELAEDALHPEDLLEIFPTSPAAQRLALVVARNLRLQLSKEHN